uniref:Reverse transcriptase domain-containing protein n=1 Tax=Rhizophagus irregularis (strain DAOM 181602 / DAOM 197198 / MUCL 43194) TaxID=747089 RepID=U9SLD6_RHIID
MITNSHHSIISTTVNISGFIIKNNFWYCVLDQIQDLNLDDRHQNNRIVDISKITNLQWENFTEILDRKIEAWDFQQLIDKFNYKIQLGYKTNDDGEKIRCRFNELWNNIMSTISIAVNIELPTKIVKYLESRNTRHKLSFVDKTMRHTIKLESLMRKISKDQDFIDNKDDKWINFWINRINKYNKDYNRIEYDKFIDNHKEITIPTNSLFSNTWIKNAKKVFKKRVKIDKNYLQAQRLCKIQDSIENQCNIIHSDIPKWLHSPQDNVKEHIVIDRAVISNENEGVRLAFDPDTIRTHAKDTFAGILRKCNTKSIEQNVFWSNIYRPKGEFTEFLRRLNFCGLKEQDIAILLRLMNNIIEDARENGRELWVVTQDMMKVYDSVSLESLFKNRQMNVIIAFSPSPTFIGGDAIQQACNYQQGYEMVNTWPTDIWDRST